MNGYVRLYKREIRAVWQEIGDLHFQLDRTPKSDWVNEDKEEELIKKYTPSSDAWVKLEIEERYVLTNLKAVDYESCIRRNSGRYPIEKETKYS